MTSMVFRMIIVFRMLTRMTTMVFRIFTIFIIFRTFRIFTKMTSMMKLSKSFLVTIQWINLRILRESTMSRIVFLLKLDFNKKFFEQILK